MTNIGTSVTSPGTVTLPTGPAYRTGRQARLKAAPFVKWAGGKGQLLSQLQPLLPKDYQRYIEPFLGGGAVFFHLQPPSALLGDSNEELLQAFEVVRDQAEELMADLDAHQRGLGVSLEERKEYYYRLRAVDPDTLTAVQRASRFICLNKTGYNGLYRVNRRGQFNVPFGRYKRAPRLYDPENLRNASLLLRRADLRCADFEATMAEAGPGDFIYLDPPYDPLSATANFTGYTAASFGRTEQERLAACMRQADQRGALVLLNNSDTPFIRELYEGLSIKAVPSFRIARVTALRAINSDPTKRKGAVELVITNYA